VTPKVARRIRNIRYDRAQIYWGNMAMHELPKYKAASLNPDIGLQPRLYMGEKDPEYLSWKYQADIFTKDFLKSGIFSLHRTAFGTKRAPLRGNTPFY